MRNWVRKVKWQVWKSWPRADCRAWCCSLWGCGRRWEIYRLYLPTAARTYRSCSLLSASAYRHSHVYGQIILIYSVNPTAVWKQFCHQRARQQTVTQWTFSNSICKRISSVNDKHRPVPLWYEERLNIQNLHRRRPVDAGARQSNSVAALRCSPPIAPDPPSGVNSHIADTRRSPSALATRPR